MKELSYQSNQNELAASTRSAVASTQQKMLSLSDSSHKFSNLIDLVQENVQQTNNAVVYMSGISGEGMMLALNAEIEAITTGKHRHGFSKLTHEISRFAERTASSTSQIKSIIKQMAYHVENGRFTVNKCLEEINTGTDRLRIIGQHLTGLTSESENQSLIFQSVESITQQNCLQAEQLINAIAPLSESAEENSKAVRHLQDTIIKLVNSADELRVALNLFVHGEQK
jgi:methyl-accepting chemotaxis protein